MTVSPGTRIGPYEIVAPLGAGGMGEVYRAKDSKLKRDVALKVLPEDVANDPERLARFQREAEVLASLNHANIAHVYGVEDRALVMELVEGEDLSQRIAQGPVPVDEALPIAKQIAEALEAAHEADIVHRDLKPANVKVRPDGTVKVLDFGLAKALEHGAGNGKLGALANSPTITSPAMTMGGVILGTAAYMAPEQAKGKPVDKRADIWAFGCVLYEMVTGRRPFEGEDVTEIIAAVVRTDPDFTRVPATLKRLLKQCLQKDPRRRLRDIGDVWTLLDEEAGPISPTHARGWITVGLSAVALIATVVASVLAYRQFRDQPPPPLPISRLHIALPAGAAPDLNFQISPDGRRLAYVGRASDGVLSVFLRALDDLDARSLPGTENVGTGSVFWSPDSRWLVFSNQGRLKKLDAIDGGPVQTIADVTGSGVVGGAWNRDGTIVIGTNPGPRPGSGGPFKVAADGGPITPVTTIDANRQELGHRFPTFLPDGRRFLYLRTSYDPEQSGIYVGDIEKPPDAQSPTRVTATPIGPVVWLPAASGEPSAAGRLLFHRESSLLVQPFDLQTFQLPVSREVLPGPSERASIAACSLRLQPRWSTPPPPERSRFSCDGTTRPTRRPALKRVSPVLTAISASRPTAPERWRRATSSIAVIVPRSGSWTSPGRRARG
jgi:serine/threonine protein kinase